MLARTNPGQAVVMARKLLTDSEKALRKDARLLLKQTKDPVVTEQIPKLLKSAHFKEWSSDEKFEFLVLGHPNYGVKGSGFRE